MEPSVDLLAIETGLSALDADVTLWRLRGHLDAVTVRSLEADFDREVKAGHVRWVVNLEGLEYISSAGLGSFIGVLSELRSRGGGIVFMGLSPKIGKIFGMLGFTRVFRVVVSEAEAVASFRGV
ncbi:MAG: STAS domain-containing protein [bacterium]